MQRSRRALLQRRALAKTIDRNHLYKLSLSLVILLWGLVFLLNLWISHGDGDRGEASVVARNVSIPDKSGMTNFRVSSWDEDKLVDAASSCSVGRHLDYRHLMETCPDNSYETFCSNAYKQEEIGSETQSGSTTLMKGVSDTGEHDEVGSPKPNMKDRKENGKPDKPTRVVPPGLDEFKNKALSSKNKYIPGAIGSVIHRVEPGGAEYNYASSAKGAKVLDSNKEAKGASNILSKDEDKYLRNPCSAESKFVIIELSEETLVDTIEIANFEHYSSNLKDFELLGSLVYPTDTWEKLGNFSAANVKHAQRFVLPEPKWVRYLKLNILSHYGSEFYCTLSFVEVYGVDAVERMLEDLISVPGNHYAIGETKGDREPKHVAPEATASNNPNQNPSGEGEVLGSSNIKPESANQKGPDPVEEVRHPQISRMPGDTALKILMQKVRSLDLSLSVLERYLEELNFRYGSIFREMDQEMNEKELLVNKIRSDIKNILDSKDVMGKDVDELVTWKSLIAMQFDDLVKDNAILRSDVRKVQERQLYMESKGIVVFLLSLIFGFVGLVILFTDIVHSLYSLDKSRKFCWVNSSWILLFLSCSTTIIILAL